MEMKKCRLKTLSLRPINIVGHIAPPHNRKKKNLNQPLAWKQRYFLFWSVFFSTFKYASYFSYRYNLDKRKK